MRNKNEPMQPLPTSKNISSDRRLNWPPHINGAVPGNPPSLSNMSRALSGEAIAEQFPAAPLDVSSRFGLRLRELRKERNLTQLRMANEFGIDRSFISDVERGRKSISLPMLEVIALGMKLTLSELLRDI